MFTLGWRPRPGEGVAEQYAFAHGVAGEYAQHAERRDCTRYEVWRVVDRQYFGRPKRWARPPFDEWMVVMSPDLEESSTWAQPHCILETRTPHPPYCFRLVYRGDLTHERIMP